jgi:hypothetical protein
MIGDPTVFALESDVKEYYECPSLLALGYYVIHVDGCCYGQRQLDSTILACSYYEVEKRLKQRGTHTAPFLEHYDAHKIAFAYRHAFYANEQEKSYLGISLNQFCNIFTNTNKGCQWAPDGDEAFDDGSYVLQFDVHDQVRLIAFKSCKDFSYDPKSIREVWLKSDEFYGILQEWHNIFISEWKTASKIQI